MKNDFRSSVQISIRAERKLLDEVEHSTQEVRGEWVKKGNSFYLRYSDEDSTNTFVKWMEGLNEVWVIRQGEVSVRQHFVPKMDLYTVYTTPYAQFQLRTLTDQLQIEVDETNGMIQLQFTSQLQESEPLEHRMTIQFHILT